MLGFIMRICTDFNAAAVFISLYYAYVRSHLEYAAVVWSPNYEVHINRIESVQKKFCLGNLGYYSIIKFAPYSFKCILLNIESLSDRRKNASILFVFDLLSARINSPKILSYPRALRNNVFLRIKPNRTNYSAFEPVKTIPSLFNEVYYLFDFGMSRCMFKRNIRNLALQNLNELP